MYCAGCGSDLGAAAVMTCPKCGASRDAGAGVDAGEVGRRVVDSSRDALRAIRTLGVDPVGGLSGAFSELGDRRAAGAGVVLCVVYTFAAAVGFNLGVRSWFGIWANASGLAGAGVFVKAILGLAVAPVALAAAVLAVRMIAGSRDVGRAAELFVAGAALAPLGLASLLGGLLGPGNFQVGLVLFLGAFCYLVLILYSGLTGVARVSPRVAAPCVPVMILLTFWLTKVFLTALF